VAGEVVLLRDLYAAAAAPAAAAEARERELMIQLVAIAHAGLIRGMRLRRHARRALQKARIRVGISRTWPTRGLRT
jgi:hypothetical protein